MTYPIPSAAFESHIAILGKTGSGKSNAAKTVAELLLPKHQRVCAVDPTGTWWGLRLAADGKRPSPWPIVIFGGEHADLPIAAEHGAAIAEAIGTSSTSAIIDTRQLSVGARTKFFTHFAETLLSKNQGELTLIIDEAHLFSPQSGGAGGRDVARNELLHAANNLVSLGRGVGLRIILISQRPAKLHKDSLTQVETLVAMRLLHNLDVGAVKAWIGEWADPEKGKEITAALPSLPKGDAFVWAPELNYLERAHFPLVSTFDSGKPLAGRASPKLKAIDVDAIKTKLTAVAQDALASDPRALRAEIATLKRQMAAGAAQQPQQTMLANQADMDRAHALGRLEGFAEGWRACWQKAYLAGHLSGIKGTINGIHEVTNAIVAEAGCAHVPEAPPPPKVGKIIPAAPRPVQNETRSTGFPKRPAQVNRIPANGSGGADSSLTGPQRAVLEGLAWWNAMGHPEVTRPQLAAKIGWKVGGGHFINRLSELSRAGMVSYPRNGSVSLTETGAAAAPAPDVSATLPDSIRAALTGPQTIIFNKLLESGAALSREDLAILVGWDVKGGHFINRLSELSRMEIIYYPERRHVALQDWVR